MHRVVSEHQAVPRGTASHLPDLGVVTFAGGICAGARQLSGAQPEREGTIRRLPQGGDARGQCSQRKSVVFSSSCLAMCCITSVRMRSMLPTTCGPRPSQLPCSTSWLT